MTNQLCRAYRVTKNSLVIFEHSGYDHDDLVMYEGEEYQLNHLIWDIFDFMPSITVQVLEFSPSQLFVAGIDLTENIKTLDCGDHK